MHYNTAAVVVEGMEEDYETAAAIDTLVNDNFPSKPKQTNETLDKQNNCTVLVLLCHASIYIAKY